jgi:3-methyladenine DNA glycosylase AlkC
VAEPFKHLIDPALVRTAARHLTRAWPDFDAARFTRLALRGLESLELKARAMHVADALEEVLPNDFAAAADVLEMALAPAHEGASMSNVALDDRGLRGWILWSAGEFVARRGVATPERALQALHAFTQRFTAEFAIRPLIIAHPALCFDTLLRWTRDPSAHVRRLVSEGSRPRLPWGVQLKSLIADPSPTLPLLRALQDDESEYVRRSVANHLNDIAKDHPAIVAQWLAEYLPGASAQRRALLRHASRTLVKRGDARVLSAWGVGKRFTGTAALTVTPRKVSVGEKLALTLDLSSTSRAAQRLVIDYVVHHVKHDGSRSPKVFKGWTVELPPRAPLRLTKKHSMKEVTTRRYYPGPHAIDVNINGVTCATATFTLVAERGAALRSPGRGKGATAGRSARTSPPGRRSAGGRS